MSTSMSTSKRDLVIKFAFYYLDKLDRGDDSLSADVREYVADKLLSEYESGILSSDDNIHGETDAQLKAFARRLVENRISDGYKVLKARLEKFESGEVADRTGQILVAESSSDEQELSASSCDLSALGLDGFDASDIIERLFRLLPQRHRPVFEKLTTGELRPGDPEARACLAFLRRNVKALTANIPHSGKSAISSFRKRTRIGHGDGGGYERAFWIMLMSIIQMIYRKPIHYRPKPRPVRPGSKAFVQMDESREENDIPSYSPYQYPSRVCI